MLQQEDFVCQRSIANSRFLLANMGSSTGQMAYNAVRAEVFQLSRDVGNAPHILVLGKSCRWGRARTHFTLFKVHTFD